MKNRNRQTGFVRAIKKFFLSAFVVVSFTLYALENRVTAVEHTAQLPGGTVAPPATAPMVTPTPAGAPPTSGPAPSAAPAQAAGTNGSGATASATRRGYKDGTYTGPSVNVNWGLVQVQATVQGGKISNIRFLQYPNDRRTSQRINSFAVPTLQQEAVQAQSANVDLITGATLTSEGFEMSLQAALNQARS